MGRRIRLLGGLLLGIGLLLACAWGLLIRWANGPEARARVVQWLADRSGRKVGLDRLVVDWTGRAELLGLKILDPAGQAFLSLPRTLVGWRLPLGDAAPLGIRVEGGNLLWREDHWRGRARNPGSLPPPSQQPGRPGSPFEHGAPVVPGPPLGRRPEPVLPVLPGGKGPSPFGARAPGSSSTPGIPGSPGGRIRLAAVGTREVEASALVDLELSGLTATLVSSGLAAEFPFMNLRGEGSWRKGGGFRIGRLQGSLHGTLPLELSAEGTPEEVQFSLELEESSLGDLAAVAPLSFVLVRFGLLTEGFLGLRVSGVLSRGRRPELEGSLGWREVALRLGNEPLLEDGEGRWNFRSRNRRGGGLQGELDLPSTRIHLFGLPLGLEEAEGRLELDRSGLRLSRMRGTSPFGSLRVGLRASWSPALQWALTLDAGGDEGSWLQGATVELTPAEILLRGVQIQGPGVDLVLDARVLPEGVDPPTWRVDQGVCVGLAKSRPVRFDDLQGLLYLDNQGGYSFNLEGASSIFRGQVAPSRDLRLWVGKSGAAPLQAIHLPTGS